jgi:hypothetical protein
MSNKSNKLSHHSIPNHEASLPLPRLPTLVLPLPLSLILSLALHIKVELVNKHKANSCKIQKINNFSSLT